MSCLELKIALQRQPEPASRLRTLLEKPGAAVLRRNYVAEAPEHEDAALRSRLRVTAVLAVDLTDPPREPEPQAQAEAEEEGEAPESEVSEREVPDQPQTANGFAKGIEIWVADGARIVCAHADAEEIAGALAMFDAYLRLARYQPAFQRLEQRVVGLSYTFSEGLSVGIQGDPGHTLHDATLDSAGAIPEVDDFRRTGFSARFSNAGVSFFHELLRSAAAWLDENSYPSILGSK